MNFREWLRQEEARFAEAESAKPFSTSATGTTRGRPGSGSGFVANRSQLWGPSATYGRADTVMPWEKPLPALATGIGQSFQQSLGWQPTPVAQFEPMPTEDGFHDRWGALPLQLPPEGFKMSRRNKLGLLIGIKELLGEGPQAVQDPRIHKGAAGSSEGGATQVGEEGDVEGKFQLMTQEMMGDIELNNTAIEFTQALLHYVHVQNMAAEGIRDYYDWQDPEVHPNVTEDNPPLFEAIFRFAPVDEGQWGTAKQYRKNKQQTQADAQAMKDLSGVDFGQGSGNAAAPE